MAPETSKKKVSRGCLKRWPGQKEKRVREVMLVGLVGKTVGANGVGKEKKRQSDKTGDHKN